MRQEFEQEYLQLGLKIAYYRKLRGLTQEGAGRAHRPLPGLRRPCGGAEYQKAVSLDTLFAIAQALDVPARRFLILMILDCKTNIAKHIDSLCLCATFYVILP